MCRKESQYLTPASPLLLLWQFPLQTTNVWVQLCLKAVQLRHQCRLDNSMTTSSHTAYAFLCKTIGVVFIFYVKLLV